MAAEVARQGWVWVLTFELGHGADQNLLLPEVQTLIKQLVRLGAFVVGLGAAPECRSFSRAVRPPTRSATFPEGLPPFQRELQAPNRERPLGLLLLAATMGEITGDGLLV